MYRFQMFTAAAAMAFGQDARQYFDGLPTPPGLGGKNRPTPVIYPEGCWRPGPEHLPPAGVKSRQVQRREAWKAGVVWRNPNTTK